MSLSSEFQPVKFLTEALKPQTLFGFEVITCMFMFALSDFESSSHKHTWIKTEEFEAFTVVPHSSVVSINSHTQSGRFRGHRLLFLQRRLHVALRDEMI